MRWFIFCVAVAGSATLILSQPPETSQVLFLLLTFAAITLSIFSLTVLERRVAPTLRAAAPPLPTYALHTRFLAQRAWQAVRDVRPGRALALFGGLVLMFIGQIRIFREPLDAPPSGAFIFMGIGLGMVLAVLNGKYTATPGAIPAPAQPERLRIKWRWMLLSVALLLLTSWRAGIKPAETDIFEQYLTWGLGLITFVIAVAPREDEPRQPDTAPLRRREYALLAGLFIAAVLVRGINLGGEPYLFDQDEAMFAQDASSIWRESFRTTPFEPGAQSWPRVYQSIIAVVIAILGPTQAAARLPSMLLSALTVPAIYLFGREMGGWRAGLIAALFVLPWSFHVQFGRFALNQSADPLFATLTFYFLLRGLRRGAAYDYAMCGLMLGLSQLFYLGGRIIPFILLAFVIFLWLRQRELIVKQWRLLLLVPLGAFLLLLPHHYFLAYTGQPLTTRADKNIFVSGQLEDVLNDPHRDLGEYLINQVKRSFLALIWIGDSGYWYGYGTNILGPFGGPFFVIGVVVSAVLLWNRPRWALPPGWVLAVIFFGSTLSISPPQYQRYVIAAAPLALLVAFGVMTVAFGIARVFQRPGAQHGVALLIGAALAIGNLGMYVGDYLVRGNYIANRPNWATNRTAHELLRAIQAGRQAVLVGDFATGVEDTLVVQYFLSASQYINYDREGLSNFDPRRPFTFVVGAKRKVDLNNFRNLFPGGRVREVYLAEDGSLAFYVYERG